MAYISTDQVKEIRNSIKKNFPTKDGWKFSITRDNYSKLNVNVMKAPMDLTDFRDGEQLHCSVIEPNRTRYDSHVISEAERTTLNTLNKLAHTGHWDKSDTMTDYFHCSWYVDVYVGKWNKKFEQSK